jgi:hypothetical protein
METLKPKAKATAEAGKSADSAAVRPDFPSPGALLKEAKKERKRVLLMEHIETINILRDEKKFTFRAIAEWLSQKGIKVDHSAVYRTYLAAIPEEKRPSFAALQSRWIKD